MRIVVDINHPAHVHYFKKFIPEMQKRGHEVLVTASEKDVSFKLLETYHIEFENVGCYGTSLVRKLINLPLIDIKYYQLMKTFQPDILIGAGSIRAAHASFLLRKPCINFEDTEHSTEQTRLYLPFVAAVCTPSCYSLDLGKKQIRFNGYLELASLHPNRFTPNPTVLTEIGLNEGDPFIIVRFVSWNASHDVGQHGIRDKFGLVKVLEEYGRVLITSEGALPLELQPYQIQISPENFHDLLYYASLYIGESGTTATEAALLGTPSILINTLAKYCGVHNELMNNYQLQYCYDNEKDCIDPIPMLINYKSLKKEWQKKRDVMLSEKIDVTDFMVNLIENWKE